MRILEPYLSVLPPAQKLLWPLLSYIPKEFVLYGGTGLALRLGHRSSEDFDFFSTSYSDYIVDLIKTNPLFMKFSHDYLPLYKHNQHDFFFTFKSIQPLPNDSHIVKVTLSSCQGVVVGALSAPDICQDNNVKVASILDIMSNKIWALGDRSKQRDYIDILTCIKKGYSLERAFAGCLALMSHPPISRYIDLEGLKKALIKEKINYFIDDPQDRLIFKNAVAQVNMNRVLKTKLTVHDELYDFKDNNT